MAKKGGARVTRGGHGGPFADKKMLRLEDFSGGKNDKFNALLLADNELADIQNMNYDEKGTLQKRLGYTARYGSTFATGPVRGLFNYRKEDGTSRLIIAADDKIFYDLPQFVKLYAVESDWESPNTVFTGTASSTTPNSLTLTPLPDGQLGAMILGGTSSMLGFAPSQTRTGTWVSDSISLAGIVDKTTGKMTNGTTAPAGTTVLFETATSADGATNWSAYQGLGAGNAIQSPGNNYLRIRVTLTATAVYGGSSVQSAQVTYDSTAAVSSIGSGMNTLARWRFATQNDILYMVNGVDANRQWDATTFAVQPGTPPVGSYIAVHKNIMFIAGTGTNRSRLYFSAIGDPTTWPALNFIDVGKGDGDVITGLAILLNNLVITKNNSVWILQGDAASNFVLRRITDEAGAVTGSSFGGIVKQILPMLARDGVYFFDGVRVALASEKITKTLAAMNQRQLAQAAAIVVGVGYTKKYWLALPEGTATTNTTIVVFDSLRSAWTVYRNMPAGELALFRQFNSDTLVFGSATTGMVYNAETGYTDNGAAIDGYFVTKALDPGGPEELNIGRRILVDGQEPQGQTTTATISFFKDLGTESATQNVTFVNPLEVTRAIPGAVGLGTFRSLGVKVRHNTAGQGLKVFGVAVEFIAKGIRPSRTQ